MVIKGVKGDDVKSKKKSEKSSSGEESRNANDTCDEIEKIAFHIFIFV